VSFAYFDVGSVAQQTGRFPTDHAALARSSFASPRATESAFAGGIASQFRRASISEAALLPSGIDTGQLIGNLAQPALELDKPYRSI
jgi:hypothetical protein